MNDRISLIEQQTSLKTYNKASFSESVLLCNFDINILISDTVTSRKEKLTHYKRDVIT